MQINPTKTNAAADRRRTARELRNLASILAGRRAREVAEDDVLDVDLGGVRGAGRRVDVEVAGVEDDGPVGVADVEVLERDVFDVAVADVGAGPGLEARSVLGGCVRYWRGIGLED